MSWNEQQVSGYAVVMEKEEQKKNLRVELSGDTKDAFERLVERKKISQRKAIERMIEFLVAQGDVAQSMILGQIQPSPKLMELIFAEDANLPVNFSGPPLLEPTDETGSGESPPEQREPALHPKGRGRSK